MKSFRLLLLLGVVLLFGEQSLFAQSKSEKDQLADGLKNRIENKQFTVDVTRAQPMSGKSVYLSSPYSLTLKGDSVYSYLPYYGRAYQLPYGGGDGLRFKEPISHYDVSYNKKGTARVRFKTRTADDYYQFDIQLFPSGSSTINITPTNRQGISFYGTLISDPK